VESGTHRELLARHDGRYRRLHEMQLQLVWVAGGQWPVSFHRPQATDYW